MTSTTQPPSPPSSSFFRSKPCRALVTVACVLCGGLFAIKLLKDKTTLSFSFVLDGKPLPVGTAPAVQVDGQPFISGLTITPGRHKLTADLQIAEPFVRHVWVIFGNKNLGALPLDSTKGSLFVSVKPSPASVTLRRGTEVVGKGDTPLTVERLLLGNYELEIKRGEYKETRLVKIEGRPRTQANIDLNLGGVNLSSDPADAEFLLSGNGRRWDGKLPAQIDEVPGGDYVLVIRRAEYEESHQVIVRRQQRTEVRIELNLGIVDLSSNPADAEFELSGNGRHWNGKLPDRIVDVPVGDYRLSVRRKGWELSADVSVGRGIATTNKTEFPYGSIEVTSEPTGLVVSTNGVEIGKTPTALRELKPGQYKLTATDGENDLTVDVSVGPKEAAKHSFIFRYGTVRLKSAPPGATVIRRGKEAGKTPLTLEKIPVGDISVELRLAGYESTNLPLQVRQSETADLAAKLISKRYLQTMKEARKRFEEGKFDDSRKSVAVALEIEQGDAAATNLLGEISEAERKAKVLARASLTWLDFQKVISDCTDTKQVQYPVVFDDGYYETYKDENGKSRQRFHKTGQHIEIQTNSESTFNPIKFSEKYEGRRFGFNCPDKWSVSKVEKEGRIILKQARGSFGSDQIRATAPTGNPGALIGPQKGQKVTLQGVLKKYEEGLLVRTLYLEDAEVLDK